MLSMISFLISIKSHYHHFFFFRLVLRIVTDDSNAICRFSMKFGADMNTARYLIEKAREIGLEVIGVRYEKRPTQQYFNR